MQLWSASADNTSFAPTAIIGATDDTSSNSMQITITTTELTIVRNGTTTVLDITSDTGNWHTVPLAAGWSTPSGYAALQYRLLADGNVQFSGAAGYSSSLTANTLINSTALGTSYRPSSKHVLSKHDPQGGVGRVEMNINGDMYMIASATYPAQYVEIDCIMGKL